MAIRSVIIFATTGNHMGYQQLDIKEHYRDDILSLEIYDGRTFLQVHNTVVISRTVILIFNIMLMRERSVMRVIVWIVIDNIVLPITRRLFLKIRIRRMVI